MSSTLKIGPLTLTRSLGRDALSEIWLGVLGDPAGKAVVARQLLPWVTRDATRLDPLIARSRDLAAAQNPALIGVLPPLRHGDEVVLMEEHVDTVGMNDVLAYCVENDQTVPYNVFLNVATQVCNGLEALHNRPGTETGSDNVLHLALRPAAIRLTREGRMLLGEFGLVRSPTALPATGMAGTTPPQMEYLSPEQTTPDQALSPSSDVFSLGSTLYEILTLEPMFRAQSNLQTIHRVRRAEVSSFLLHAKERLPGLDKILYRALSLNPRHRYQRAFVLREDLRGLMSGFSFARIADETREFLAPVFAARPEDQGVDVPLANGDSTDSLIASISTSAPPVRAPEPSSETRTVDSERPLGASTPTGTLEAPPSLARPGPLRDLAPEIQRLSSIEGGAGPTLHPEDGGFEDGGFDEPELVPTTQARPGDTAPFERKVQSSEALSSGASLAFLRANEEETGNIPDPPPHDETSWFERERRDKRPPEPVPASEEDTQTHTGMNAAPTPEPAAPKSSPKPQPKPKPAGVAAAAPPPAKRPPPSTFDEDDDEDFGERRSFMPMLAAGAVAAVAIFACVGVGGGLFLANSVGGDPLEGPAAAAPADASPAAPPVEPPAKREAPKAEPPPVAAPPSSAKPPPAAKPPEAAERPASPPVAAKPPSSPPPSRAATPPPASSARSTAPAPAPAPVAVAKASPPPVRDYAPPPVSVIEDAPIAESVPTEPSIADLGPKAWRGQLSEGERANLAGIPQSSPDYSAARIYLYEDARARGDWSGRSQHLAALMAVPENQYNPALLVEQGEMAIETADYGGALDSATLAERHWARLPSDLIFSRKAMIYEIQAAAWQGIFYESEGDDSSALDAAIQSWQKYQRHVASRSRNDLVAKADEQLTKLFDAQRRLE